MMSIRVTGLVAAMGTLAAGQGARNVAVSSATLGMVNASQAGADYCLNFQELFLFNTNGQLVSIAGVNGVTVNASTAGFNSTVAGAYDFQLGPVTPNTVMQNPYQPWGRTGYHSANCTPSQAYQYQFAVPQVLAAAVFIPRNDGAWTLNSRPIFNRYTLTTRAPNNTAIETTSLGFNATVVTRTLSTGWAPVVLPDPQSPQQLQLRDVGVRYVRVTLPAAAILHFRELWVFDNTWNNVARNRSCTMSGAVRVSPTTAIPPSTPTGCDKAVDMVNDFDTTFEGAGLFHHISTAAGQWAEWDLGGMYSVQRIVLFNRWQRASTTGGTEGPRIAGAVITLKNFWNETLASYTLPAGAPFYSIPVALTNAVPSREPSASVTPQSTPSASLSVGATPSSTGSPSATATGIPAGAVAQPVAIRISTPGSSAPMNVVEVMAWSPSGRLLTSVGSGAVATAVNGVNDPSLGIDLCADGYMQSPGNGCAYWEAQANTPAEWLVTFPAPSDIATIWVSNRNPGPWSSRFAGARALLQVINQDGTIAAAWNITSTSGVSTFNMPGVSPQWPLGVDTSVDFQTSEANRLSLVRYVQVNANAGVPMMFRELAVLDDTWTNVAAGKPITGPFQSVADIGVGAVYTLAMANNLVLGDIDATTGDMTFGQNNGGQLTIDLGMLYNVRGLLYVARAGTGCNTGWCPNRFATSTVNLLNWYGSTVGTYTIGTGVIQWAPITLFQPSQTPTSTPTVTGTATNTPSSSGTGTPTATPSGTISSGAVPSITPTGSLTPSTTPTGSRTATASPSATSTVKLALPGFVRIQNSGSAVNMNFLECIVISTSNQVLSHPSRGAFATASSTLNANTPPVRGIDLQIDPMSGTNSSNLVHSGGTAAPSEWWQVTFTPSQVARIIFVNRGEAALNLRIVLGGAYLALIAHNGTEMWRTFPTADFVQVFDLAPLPNSLPPPVDNSNAGLLTKARYLVIYVQPGAFYSFREVQVLGADLQIVSQGRSATVEDNGQGDGTASAGTNGVITYDVNSLVPNATNDLVLVNASGLTQPAKFTIDLGGLFGAADLAGVWVWHNRFRLPPAGTRVEFVTTAGLTVFNASFGTNRGAEWINLPVLGGFYAPSDSPSPSVSPSNTPSSSQTPSNTGSLSATATTTRTGTGSQTSTRSATSSVSATATSTGSPSATLSGGATPSVSNTPAPTNPVAIRVSITNNACLNFYEVLAFDIFGKLISHASTGATGALSLAPYSAAMNASNGNDGCFESNSAGPLVAPCNMVHGACNTSGFAPILDAAYTLTFGPTPEWPAGLPQPVGQVIFINRFDSVSAALGARITAGRGNMSLLRVDGSVSASVPLNAGSATTMQVAPVVLPAMPEPASEPVDVQASRVRYVRIQSTSAWHLHFKEIMVWDEAFNNVILNKPVTGMQQFQNDGSPYSLIHGNDGIVDGDVVPLNLVHSAVQGGWWEADLQGMYLPTRITVFNRIQGSIQTRLAGSNVTFLNNYRAVVGQVTLNGNSIQSFPVSLFAPSSTPSPTGTGTSTPTPTTSLTATQTPTGTGTPSSSETPSATASISGGVTPSITGSSSSTSSITPSSSVTASYTASITSSVSATASMTPSALSTLPSQVRIDLNPNSLTAQCLNGQEVMVFDASFRVLSASAAGGVGRLSTNGLWGSGFATGAQANDLSIAGTPFLTNCTGPQFVTVDFPPANVASIVFVNRVDSGASSRIALGLGSLSLFAQTGASLFGPATMTNGFVQHFTLAPFVAPALPDPASDAQTSVQGRFTRPRFLRITAPAGAPLAIREVLAFDNASLTNVAFGKSVATTGSVWRGTPGGITDGVFAVDILGASASQVFLNASAGVVASVTIDLGALFDVANVQVYFDRFVVPASALSLELLNWAQEPVANVAIPAGQAFWSVSSIVTSPPSMTPSSTSSPSSTGTATNTASNTATATRSATTTPTSSLTRTPSSTGSAAATRSRSGTPSLTPSPSTTPTGTAASTKTPTSTAASTQTPTGTGSQTGTASPSGTASNTRTPTSSRTRTPSSSTTATGSVSATSSETASVSATQTGTPSSSSSQTGTPSSSQTETGTPSSSQTMTGTGSSSASQTASQTGTPSSSSTGTAASTGTGTSASTGTGTSAATGTATKTRVPLPSSSPTRTRTRTASRTKTKTKTKTRTPSKKKKLMA